MNEQLAALRMAGALKSSTEVMKNMQNLVKVGDNCFLIIYLDYFRCPKL